MNVSIVKQIQHQERRVPLVPAGVKRLVEIGNVVHVEHDAGLAAGFSDDDYLQAGAHIVYSRAEAIGRAELVMGVSPVQREDTEFLLPGQTIMSFGHLVTLHHETISALCDKGVTAVAYEWIENEQHHRPIVEVMGEIAGPIAVTMAARFLESHHGGRGVLLSGAPGIPPAHTVIIGGGTVGVAAARAAVGLGSQVIVLDKDPDRLRLINDMFDRRVITYRSYGYNLEKVIQFADAVIGAVWVRGGRPPLLITREMMRTMKPRSVIVDCSIDQGGITEIARPTSLTDPIFVDEGVIHCNIPNLPATVARTASFALANALFPYTRHIAEGGIEAAIKLQPGFREGIYIRQGEIHHPAVAGLMDSVATHSIVT
ncbi:MAG: alanine dehydrogenase [candidate division Zixibacteria bacterium]|nr:alanine dehydrogenase [candidate division Zixibacteria bacterium]